MAQVICPLFMLTSESTSTRARITLSRAGNAPTRATIALGRAESTSTRARITLSRAAACSTRTRNSPARATIAPARATATVTKPTPHHRSFKYRHLKTTNLQRILRLHVKEFIRNKHHNRYEPDLNHSVSGRLTHVEHP